MSTPQQTFTLIENNPDFDDDPNTTTKVFNGIFDGVSSTHIVKIVENNDVASI